MAQGMARMGLTQSLNRRVLEYPVGDKSPDYEDRAHGPCRQFVLINVSMWSQFFSR
jgi:hypothetical protein